MGSCSCGRRLVQCQRLEACMAVRRAARRRDARARQPQAVAEVRGLGFEHPARQLREALLGRQIGELVPVEPELAVECLLELLDHRYAQLWKAFPVDRARRVAPLITAQAGEFVEPGMLA